MFALEQPWHELILRCVMLYGFVLFALRLANREGGEVSPIDQVVLFTIGDLIASAAVKSDDSLSAAFLATATFVGMSYLLHFLSFSSTPVSRLLDGIPVVLIHNGSILWKAMKKEQITKQELMEAVRASGNLSIADIHVAMLETNGTISVIAKKSAKP